MHLEKEIGKKEAESLEKLAQIAGNNTCGEIDPYTFEDLIYFQQSDNCHLRNLARELALEIPTNRLDLKTLIAFQKSNDPDVRDLTRELANKIPTDWLDFQMLMEYQLSSFSRVRSLSQSLIFSIPIEKISLQTIHYWEVNRDSTVFGGLLGVLVSKKLRSLRS